MADLLSQARAALASRFRVERELGRGGMATVFLAEDLKHNRLLAVKILHPDLAAAIGPDRFRAEIAFAAHLNHPHILPLIDSGEDAGLLWFAMPYVEGETLRDRLVRVGPLPPTEVADLARQVAAAMDYAHGLGILHRDIKPENLLLAHGHVWVADFGIAMALKEGAEGAEIAAGTPGYMSPEQMAGEAADRRTDIFSLGAVVWEALTGQRPAPDFGSQPRLHGRRSPVRPNSLRPALPPRMEAALRKALAPVPSERQATAGEFSRDLSAAVTNPKVRQAARSGWLRGGLVTFGVATAIAAGYYVMTRPPDYDDNRVLILPVQGPGRTSPAWGEDLAVALESQFNSTRVLVARSARGDTAAGPIAAATRSRYSVQAQAFSDGTLQITLWDHRESLGEKADYRVPDEGLVFARAVEIATAMLPRLIPTGGQIDQSVFGQSGVASLAAFLQGERAYRAGAFATADSLFGEAVRLDSGFTWAALRGAQAASWNTRHDRALVLVQLALRTTDSLGPRYAAFARGLEDYQKGEADSAVVHLREAIGLDSLWAEAHMALAEVYHHYLPQEGAPLDSAWRHFTAAREFDPTFTPPLFHLIQLAVWRDDRAAAESLYRAFRDDANPMASGERYQAGLMVGCLTGATDPGRWREAMADNLGAAAQAAVWLAVGGLQQGKCAADGLRAVPSDPASAGFYAAYAPVILAHVLAAQGDSDGVRRLLESPNAMAPPFRAYAAIAIEVAGLPVGRDLVDQWKQMTLVRIGSPADTVATRRIQDRWLLGTLAVSRGDLATADAWLDSLRRLVPLPAAEPQRLRFIASLDARLQLARGDTARALAVLEALSPMARQVQLRWSPWHAFAHERMLRARLYQARGQTQRALEVESGFDSPASYGLLLYLPGSLQRRQDLAERRGEVEYLARITARSKAMRAAALGDLP